LENHTGAIAYYDKVLAIDPNYDLALFSKGVALDSLGNHTGAIKYYDKAFAINPNISYQYQRIINSFEVIRQKSSVMTAKPKLELIRLMF
jgi:tetratricopeptide (TPR) repeat protein